MLVSLGPFKTLQLMPPGEERFLSFFPRVDPDVPKVIQGRLVRDLDSLLLQMFVHIFSSPAASDEDLPVNTSQGCVRKDTWATGRLVRKGWQMRFLQP